MTWRLQLLAALGGAAVLAAGIYLWRNHGLAVWLEQGLGYCF